MKRKILALTLSIVMSASMLAGCGSRTPSGPINPGSGEDKEQSVDAEDSVETVDETESVGEADTQSEAPEETGEDESSQGPEVLPNVDKRDSERVVLSDIYSSVAYIVDGKGNKVEEIDYEDFKSDSSKYTDIQALEYYDGFLIAKAGRYDNENWVTDYFAYDTVNGGLNVILSSADGEYVRYMDDYDGKLYVGLYDYEGKDGTVRMRETSYHSENGALVEDTEETDAQAILKKNEGIWFEVNKDNSSDYNINECYTRQLRENGYLLASQDKTLVKFDASGKKTEIDTPDDSYKNVYGFDADHILYSVYNAEEEGYDYKAYSLSDGSVKDIPELANAIAIDYSDGRFYYYYDQSEEYGVQNNHVYSYDMASGTFALIYETRNVPGYSYISGIRGFTLIEGEIYFVDIMDRELKWVRVNYDESGASYTDIYCPVEKIGTLMYGNVDYTSKQVNCPFCGIALYKEYKEIFKLQPEYSEYSDKINADIENYVAEGSESEEMFTVETDEECDEHLEYPSIYCISIDKTVSKVSILSDRYLLVDYSGYYYAGGAHGMPSEDQLVYDLTTGERISLKDIYSGSEKDFVSLVESIVTRDFENGESYIEYMYNPDDLDSILKSIRESTSMEYGIFFGENGISVRYSPYVMGPFASGFIDVFITYQELLGRDTL